MHASRLGEAGTTYRALRDAHCCKLAIELLSDTSFTAAEVGYRLGYEDASNFGKACHRWFGCSPGALQRRLRERPRKRARRGHTSIGACGSSKTTTGT
jgi:AraC-like DNA-binding protein